MFDRVMQWLAGQDALGTTRTVEVDPRRVAAAALLVEAATLDGQYDPVERERIRVLLERRFGLSDKEAHHLLSEGEAAQVEATDLFRLTHAAVRALDEAERVGLIEMLWDVVYADGEVHDLEASLLRRVAGLIHVSDRASGLARQRVRERLAQAGGAGGPGQPKE